MAMKVVDEPMYTTVPFDDPQTGNTALVAFSSDGSPKNSDAFTKAYAEYEKTRRNPAGFIFMEPGVAATLRKGFEAVRKPVQGVAEDIGGATGALASAPGALIAALVEKAGIAPEGASRSVADLGSRFGRGTANIATSPLDTPEQAGAALLGALAAAKSGGMSVPIQMLRAGLGTATGYLVGGTATGSFESRKEALTESALAGSLAALTQGATGYAKYVLGRGLSKRAQEQVAEDMAKVIREEFGNIINDPARFEQFMSTPRGVAAFTQSGMKAVMNDIDETVTALAGNINSVLPRSLSRGSQNTMRAQLRHITDASRDILDDVGNDRTLTAKTASINDAVVRIRELLDSEFSNLNASAKTQMIARVDEALLNFNTQMQQYQPIAMLLQSLKRSGQDRGFNVLALQEELADKYLGQGSFMEKIGLATGRGSDLLGGNIDRAVRPGEALVGGALNLSGLPPMVQRILKPIVGLGPQIGTQYSGTVRGQFPRASAALSGGVGAGATPGLKSFFDEGKKQ